jgi:octaprenyl-diphosphate synthase
VPLVTRENYNNINTLLAILTSVGKIPTNTNGLDMTLLSSQIVSTPESDMDNVRKLIIEDMELVNNLIQKKLYSEVELINQLGNYIVNSGGKRLRPILVLLGAGVFSYRGNLHIELAAIVEFIHTATLLHDDVVDASLLRRGQKTANQRWGNEASVLVGDFLYSRAFQMMVEVDSMRIMEILSETTNTIAEGEVQQLINCHDPDTTEDRYLKVIQNKTAKLFEAASLMGAIISNRPIEEEIAMASYGRHLGTAYQLIDDVLDYSGSADELGKNIGDDLSEGKPTLPLLYAMEHSSNETSQLIRNAIENGGIDKLDQILDAIESTGAITYTAQRAKEESEMAIQAISILPESEYLDALNILARFSLERTH